MGPIARLTQRLSRVTSSGRYVPELDGLRFVAIGLVVWQHVQQHIDAREDAQHRTLDFVSAFVQNMRIGVELFFVISGFILGLPFAMHFVRGDRKVDLKKYFLRRLTRLEPPYVIAMIAFFGLMSW